MRIANIVASLAVGLWLGFILVGRGLIEGVITQHIVGYPNIGQLETYILWPTLVTIVVLITAWLCNGLRRWPWLLTSVASASLILLIPYLFVYSGGV
jgi:hypothetical protein